mgnify:FL=1
MKRKKIGIAILLGMALCVSTAFTAVSVYGAEASETSDPSVNDNGAIITDIDSRYNENKQRGELIAYLGAEEMEFQIWQEGEYGFGGLRWSIWGDMNDSYTEISINKKLLKDAYQQTDVPVEVETVLGNYCLDNDLMRYLVKKGRGKDIKLVLEKIELSNKEKAIYGEDAYACKAYFLSGGKKITDLGYNTVQLTLSIRQMPGGLAVGRLNSKGKLYEMEARFGGQVGRYRCRFTTNKMGTFIVTSSARLNYAKRVIKVTSESLNVQTAAKKNAVTVSWKKPKAFKPKGYQVYASAKKAGTYKRIRTTGKLSCVDSGLMSGTKQYYKVRAYAMINGTRFYSKWSNVKAAVAK